VASWMEGLQMNSEDIIKKLDQLLEERKKVNPFDHQFYVFKEPGERFYGRLIDTLEDKFGRTRYLAMDLNTGEEYILPGHTVLMNELEDIEAKVGDYIVIEYEGKIERDGKEIYRYRAAKLPVSSNTENDLSSVEEDVDKLINDLEEYEEDVTVDSVFEDEEDADDEKEESIDQTDIDAVKKHLSTLLKITDELPVSEVEYYLDMKGIKVKNLPKVAESLGFGYDEDRNVIYKKE